MKQFATKKEYLRHLAKKLRLRADFDDYTITLMQNIKKTIVYNSSQNLMLYHPIGKEINILPLIGTEKKVSFPCIRNDEIVPYLCGDEFCCGKFNIQEPVNTPEQNPADLDLIIIPALCADLNGYRIGYGKGYYDRFIKKLNRKRTKLITIIWDEFLVEDIAPDEFDEKSDFVITEKRIIEISQ